MADHLPTFRPGADLTFTVGATAVTGGQLVELSDDRTVIPAGAGSDSWVGVAAFDAAVGAKVTVFSGSVHRLSTAATLAAGDAVVAAADGAVAGATTETGLALVGIALEATDADADTVLVKLVR